MFKSWQHFKLGTKLILSTSLIVVILAVIVLTDSLLLINRSIKAQLNTRLLTSLSSADLVIQNKIEELKAITDALAQDNTLRDAILRDNLQESMGHYLRDILLRKGLSLLTVTNIAGEVYARGVSPKHFGDSISIDGYVKRAFSGFPSGGTEIMASQEIFREYLKSVDKAQEGAALALKATVPMYDKMGYYLLGTVTAGYLLNDEVFIVNQIREICDCEVFVYLGSNLISSSNKDPSSLKRGPTLTPQVLEVVYQKGQNFFGEADVSQTPYFVAFKPIKNSENKAVGVLGIGLLQQPFMHVKKITQNHLIMIYGAGLFLMIGLMALLARGIVAPIKELMRGMSVVEKGNLDYKIDVHGNDEIGNLTSSFNQMTGRLKVATDRIREYSLTLEQKVEERTKELKETQEHLIQSEKMATVGTLAGGVAHEINTPLGAILNNTEMLLKEMTSDFAKENLELIRLSTLKCKTIVTQLLNYSHKPTQTNESVNTNQVLDDVCVLIENQFKTDNIDIQKAYSPLPEIINNSTELAQIFTNILVNARDAINSEMLGSSLKENGIIRISTFENEGYVNVVIVDNGCGIEENNLNKIFDPFFTTKDIGKGTGLGLYIVRRIIDQFGGKVEVKSKKGEGTTVTIKLRV